MLALQYKPAELREAEAKPTPQPKGYRSHQPVPSAFPLSMFPARTAVLKGVGLWSATVFQLQRRKSQSFHMLSLCGGREAGSGQPSNNSKKEEGVEWVWDRGSAGGSKETLRRSLFRVSLSCHTAPLWMPRCLSPGLQGKRSRWVCTPGPQNAITELPLGIASGPLIALFKGGTFLCHFSEDFRDRAPPWGEGALTCTHPPNLVPTLGQVNPSLTLRN